LRYYFHIASSESVFADQDGQELDNIRDARALAAVIADELAQDDGVYSGFVVLVVDDNGTEVDRVPINSKGG
jgi:hypothetical protein